MLLNIPEIIIALFSAAILVFIYQRLPQKNIYVLGFLFAVFNASLFYILAFVQRLNIPPEVLMFYGGGDDPQYYQLMPQFGKLNLSEPEVYEYLGRGMVGYSIPMILLHAILFLKFNIFGFILADILIFFCFFLLLNMFFRLAGSPKIIALILSILLTSACGLSTSSYFTVWGTRFPRPYVVEVFLLAAMTSNLMMLCSTTQIINKKTFWLGSGAVSSLLLQCDPYAGISIMIIECFTGIIVLASYPQYRKALFKGFLFFLLGMGFLMIPFFIQQLNLSEDSKGRIGLFPVHGLHNFVIGETTYLIFTVLLLQLCVPAGQFILNKRRPTDLFPRLYANVFAFLLPFVSHLAMPIFLFLTHKGILLYHFADRFVRLRSYALLLGGIFLLYDIWPLLKDKPFFRKNVPRIGLAVLFLSIFIHISWSIQEGQKKMAVTYHLRPDLYGGVSKYYRNDFAELVRELKYEKYRHLQILGTFDHLVQAYWQIFKRGYSYLPDICISAVPDSESEMRLIKLAKIVQMPEKDFINYLTGLLDDKTRQSLLYFGSAKYQAHQGYTFAPLTEYSPEEQDIIRKTPITDTWNIIIPKSEIVRMRNKFKNTQPDFLDTPKLEMIILTNDSIFDHYSPSEKDFMLSFQNRSFRIWVKRSLMALHEQP